MKMKKVNGVRRCRLCACEEDFTNFTNIFDDDPELELEMKITKLLPVVVMPWDPMPHVVCHKCVSKLNSYNDFYEASLKTERFLRTLYPSAPENELENLDPVVEVIDPPVLNRTSIKLPPKKRQAISTPGKNRKDSANSSEFSLENHLSEEDSKRTLNCFIVNQITDKDSVLTCRKCFRTFTRQSSALAHSCVRLEDCGEIEEIRIEEDEEDASGKALPPLKIRLFSVRSGMFVCHLCQSRFEKKADVVEHIKEHFADGQWEGGGVKKYKQRGKRKGRQSEARDDDDWEETYKKNALRRKRKKSTEPPRKRGKTRSVGVSEECLNEICVKCGLSHNSSDVISPVKETMEQMTQYSEVSDVSDEEIQVKDDDPSSVLMQSAEEPVKRIENFFETPAEPEHASDLSFPEKSVILENVENADDLVEILQTPEVDSKTDEVTVLEVINNKTHSSFFSCVFCDKVFSTKDALIAHQNRHLQGHPGCKLETGEKKTPEPAPVLVGNEEAYLCSICAMMFTSQKTMLEHEQCHFIDADGTAGQRKIRIALGHEFSEREVEQECQISKGRGFITITVTSGEKTIPQIEFI